MLKFLQKLASDFSREILVGRKRNLYRQMHRNLKGGSSACRCSLQFICVSEWPFHGHYSPLDSHTNTVSFSRGYLLVNLEMASKTMTRSIRFIITF